MNRPFKYLIGCLIFAFFCAAGCQTSAKHFTLTGKVLAKDDSTGQISVDGDTVPGFMPAMTMNYAVKDPAAFQRLQPGDKISADIVVNDGSNYLQHVVVTAREPVIPPPVSSPPPSPIIGKKPPSVSLTNQDSKMLRLSDFRGKAVLITFIYTRCPMPNFCPLISSEFAEIDRDLEQTPALLQKTQLVSITLDPAHDTPPVLREYGLAYLKGDSAGFRHWDFVSATPDGLGQLASAFGLAYYQENNQITHSMSTILIGRDGIIKQIWPGNEWKVSEVLAALKTAAA